MNNLEVIFENEGGITVQSDHYAHYYQDAACAAQDAGLLLAGENPSDLDWEYTVCEPIHWTVDDVRNGAYRVLDAAKLVREIDSQEPINTGWSNMNDFLRVITKRKVEADEYLLSYAWTH